MIEKLKSRKLWVTIAGGIVLAANGQWTEFIALVAAYLGIQGLVDVKSA